MFSIQYPVTTLHHNVSRISARLKDNTRTSLCLLSQLCLNEHISPSGCPRDSSSLCLTARSLLLSQRLTHAGGDDGQRQVVRVEEVGHQQEVHVTSVTGQEDHRVLVDGLLELRAEGGGAQGSGWSVEHADEGGLYLFGTLLHDIDTCANYTIARERICTDSHASLSGGAWLSASVGK